MEWVLPFLLTVGMALAGAAALFGKDWVRKREEQGLSPLPPVAVMLIYMMGVVFFWICVAVLLMVFLVMLV